MYLQSDADFIFLFVGTDKKDLSSVKSAQIRDNTPEAARLYCQIPNSPNAGKGGQGPRKKIRRGAAETEIKNKDA